MKFIDNYLARLGSSLDGCEDGISRAVSLVKDLRSAGGRLWILGNGGSMAIAQHCAQDLLKMRAVRAHAINCPSQLTAFSNDNRFESVFSAPLDVLRSHGDAVMIFSCSGSSRNYDGLLRKGWSPIIAVVGTDGGFLKRNADVCVHVKSSNYQICETAFSVVADMINMGLEDDSNA